MNMEPLALVAAAIAASFAFAVAFARKRAQPVAGPTAARDDGPTGSRSARRKFLGTAG